MPAVWRAGPDLLKVYGDLGLTALPLGSDGLPLPSLRDDTPPRSSNTWFVSRSEILICCCRCFRPSPGDCDGPNRSRSDTRDSSPT